MMRRREQKEKGEDKGEERDVEKEGKGEGGWGRRKILEAWAAT